MAATDCLWCRTPRPGAKEKGLCGGCWMLWLAECALNVQKLALAWRKALVARTSGTP